MFFKIKKTIGWVGIFALLLGCIFAFPGIWKGWIEGVIVGLMLGAIIGIVFGSIGSLIPGDLNQGIRRGISGNSNNRFGNIIAVSIGHVIEYGIWGILLGVLSICIKLNFTILLSFNSPKENNYSIFEILKWVAFLVKRFWIDKDFITFFPIFFTIGLIILIFVKIIASSYKKFRKKNLYLSK